MMTMSLLNLPPGFILLAGALLVPFLRGRVRSWFVILLPALAFWQILQLGDESSLRLPFLDLELSLLRVDGWSKAFGYVFTLSAFAAFIYGYHQQKSIEFVAALLYIGSALMVVFAGDLITLYIFWEVMAVTSVFLVLARKTQRAYLAGRRYILVHIFGGLVLLAGIVLFINQHGSADFQPFAPENTDLASWLILFGFLVNAAAVPFSSWLPDAYPEATAFGGVILSAYTTKTAVYTLVRGFPGWEILIVLGCIMALYGIIYALLENDIRRLLAFSIINQVGFMVIGIGIGTPLALAGSVAHAFCSLIYKSLLWMSAGAVLFRTGRSKFTELGGLYRSMPWTLALGAVGALAFSALPLTSGFTSKTIIIAAAANEHLFRVWLILEIASVGAFLLAGAKFPYFTFFGEDRGLRPPEAPKSMLAGMSMLALFCVLVGMFPEYLYNILPNGDVIKAAMPSTFADIYIHHIGHVVTQLQMLLFSALIFFLFLPKLRSTDTITLDIDWFYRKGSDLFYHVMNTVLNGLNRKTNDTVAVGFTAALSRFFADGPARLCLAVVKPFWQLTGVRIEGAEGAEARFLRNFSFATFTIGSVGIFVILFLLVLLI